MCQQETEEQPQTVRVNFSVFAWWLRSASSCFQLEMMLLKQITSCLTHTHTHTTHHKTHTHSYFYTSESQRWHITILNPQSWPEPQTKPWCTSRNQTSNPQRSLKMSWNSVFKTRSSQRHSCRPTAFWGSSTADSSPAGPAENASLCEGRHLSFGPTLFFLVNQKLLIWQLFISDTSLIFLGWTVL